MNIIYRWMFQYVHSLKALWLITGGQSFKKRSVHKMNDKLEYMSKYMLKDKKNILTVIYPPCTFEVKHL